MLPRARFHRGRSKRPRAVDGRRSSRTRRWATWRRSRPFPPGRARRMRGAARAVLALLALTLPFWVGNPYYLHVAIMAGIFGVLALSLNLLLGFPGPLPLGHAAFFGTGASTPPPPP